MNKQIKIKHLCVRQDTEPGKSTVYLARCGASGTDHKLFMDCLTKTTCEACKKPTVVQRWD